MEPSTAITFESYDFENDQIFQKGKEHLLLKFQSGAENQDEILLRVKKFYFEKFVVKEEENDTNKEGAEDIRREGADSALKEEEKSNQVNTPRLTLNEIMQLIQEGKEVPGIREIPNKVNEKPASLSKLEPRIKPWMK